MSVLRPRVNADAMVVEIDGEAVVYDDARGQIHYLNHSAALVLDLCDGTATEAEMAAAIAGVYEMPASEVEAQVREAVGSLRGLGLLEDEEPATAARVPRTWPRPEAE